MTASIELIGENLIHAELEAATKHNRVPFTTAKGRTATVVARLLAVMDRKLKLIQLVGLERRSKPVNPLDAVQRAVEDANKR